MAVGGRCVSWDAYTWVWEHSSLTGTGRLVMLALADHADDAGYCWPSIDRLAAMCRVNRKTVLRGITLAEEAGELVVDRPEKRGRGRVNRYQMTLSTGSDNRRSEMVPSRDHSERNGGIHDLNGGIHDQKWSLLGGPEPSITPIEPRGRNLVCDDGHLWDDDGTSYGECPTCRGQGCDTGLQLEAVQG